MYFVFFLRYYDILCRKFLIYAVNFLFDPEAACG